MADPATILAGVGMASTAAGGLIGAYGAEATGAATAKTYEFKAGVAKLNAQIDEQNADYARAGGEVKAQESDLRTKAVVGSTRATQGASGLDVNYGSNRLVVESEYAVGAENTGIIRSNAAKQAYGFETEAVESNLTGDLDMLSADAARRGADVSALTSILGASSSVASKWYQYGSTFGGGGGFAASQQNPSSWIPAPRES